MARFAFLLFGLITLAGVYANFDVLMEEAQADCGRPQDLIIGVRGFAASDIAQKGRVLSKTHPYLRVRVQNQEWRSTFKVQKKNPVWDGESTIFCVKQNEDGSAIQLNIQVWDHGGIFKDRNLGQTTIDVDIKKCDNRLGQRGCDISELLTTTLSKSGTGGYVKFNIQAVDLAALRAANKKIICKPLDAPAVNMCKMVKYNVVSNPDGKELTTTQLDQGAKQSYYRWQMHDMDWKKLFGTGELELCERWAATYFCANRLRECEGSGEQKRIKLMCKSTCVNFFESCYEDGEAIARKSCDGLLEDESCTSFETKIKKEDPDNEMKKYVDSNLEQAFIDTVKASVRKTDPKAIPGAVYHGYVKVPVFGVPLVFGIWNVIPRAVDLQLALDVKDGHLTLSAKGRVAASVSFWARVLSKHKVFGFNDYGSFTLDDPNFELVVKATYGSLESADDSETPPAEAAEEETGLSQAVSEFDDAAAALKEQLDEVGEFIDTTAEAKIVNAGWTSSDVYLKINVNLAKGANVHKWYLKAVLSRPIELILNALLLLKGIRNQPATAIAKLLTGRNMVTEYLGRSGFEISMRNHIVFSDPDYTRVIEGDGVTLESRGHTGTCNPDDGESCAVDE